MKNVWILLLSLCILFSLAACGDDVSDDTPAVLTLSNVAGYYKTHELYEGETPIDHFYVDADAATVTILDNFGERTDEVYACFCDENGFSIDFADDRGIVTYLHSGTVLMDMTEEPVFKYYDGYASNRDALNTSATVTLDELYGTWYRDGVIGGDEEVQIVIEEAGYHVVWGGEVGETAANQLIDLGAGYLGMEYEGATLQVDPFLGPFSSTLWVFEDGTVLYDDLFRRYYLKDSVTDEAQRAYIRDKYDLIRDAWPNTDDTGVIEFGFDGQVRTLDGDGFGSEVIGTWQYADGIVRMTYTDGTTEDVVYGDTLTVAYTGETYERYIEWE